MTYSRPTKAIKVLPLPYELQPLRALVKPPAENIPTHPPRPAVAPIPGFDYSRHVAPAAYPRSIIHATGKLRRESEPYGNVSAFVKGSKEEKKAAVRRAIATSAKYNQGARPLPEDDQHFGPPLYMAVDRWKRKQPVHGGRSLIMTHANGFNKESWHVLLRKLLVDSNARINEVWGLDAVNHGASVDLNAGRLGPANAWCDNGRDVQAFILHAMPKQGEKAGPVLKWHSAQEHTVIGVGHSYGGSAHVRAAAQNPELYEGLFLVEPMARPYLYEGEQKVGEILLTGALRRRTHWQSVEEASSSLLQSPFFQSWDPEVFKSYLDYGLVPHPDGGVQLATPNWCEGQVFGTDWGIIEGWTILPKLQTRTHFVMAGDATQTGGEEATADIVWRPPNATNERFMSSGHLVVHEKPVELARAMTTCLEAMSSPKAKL